jgi:hypothetical protein
MTTQVYGITPVTTEIVINIREKGVGKFLEFAFNGNLGGGSIDIYRRFLDDNGNTLAEIPMTFSATNQTIASINQDSIAGISFEGLIPESDIVFKPKGSGITGTLYLLGISA